MGLQIAITIAIVQRRLTLLEEAADGGLAFETDGDFVRLASFVMGTGLGRQFRACSCSGLAPTNPTMVTELK
jgi:hypothetical protein